MTDRVEFNVHSTQLSHFGDQSFQAVSCTGTDTHSWQPSENIDLKKEKLTQRRADHS